MEHALFLNRLDGPLPADYQRLYFGSEFCSWTFPAAAACRAARRAARTAGWAFTLATPVAAEAFLPHLQQTLESLLPELDPQDEILVSDWGTLALLRRLDPTRTVALGRVLSGQKRGPQILDLQLTPEQLRYFQQGSWYAAEAVRLLTEQGIVRVELDNLLQGLAPLPAPLRGTLHLPWAMVTSSRNCPFRSGRGDAGCAAGCGEVFTLGTPQSQVLLYQGGNTQFLRYDTPPADLTALRIDRLVQHPQLPR